MSKPKRGVFMKKARKISCLLAIIMSVLIASCSNASGGTSTTQDNLGGTPTTPTNPTGPTNPTTPTTPTSNTSKVYTVTFVSNGGTSVTSQSVNEGSCVLRPSNPSKTNYIFSGWCLDSALTTVFDFATPITADTRLYAKWRYGFLVTPENVGSLDLSTEYGELALKVEGDFSNLFTPLSALVKSYTGGIILDMSEVTGIRKIPDQAFINSSISDVTLPNSIVAIGDAAFCGITSIKIPSSITNIDNNAFYPNKIKTINYAGTLEQWSSKTWSPSDVKFDTYDLYLNGQKITEIEINNIANFKSAFGTCSSISKIIILDGVESIADNAFKGYTCLTDITIPNSVTSIGSNAFDGCKNLTITIPANITNIGAYAFYGCAGLAIKYQGTLEQWCKEKLFSKSSYDLYIDNQKVTNVVIPNSITSISTPAFRNCTSLTKITIPNSVTSIDESVFSGCANLEEITIPFVGGKAEDTSWETIYFGYIFFVDNQIPAKLMKVTVTGGELLYESFQGCKNLTNITIPDSITSIGQSVFENCTSLASITIPNGVTSIEKSAFANCVSLANITIPESVKSIGKSAFSYCTNLASITIPNGVTSIKESVFANCTNLASITIPDSVTSIEESAFSNCTNLASITIPKNITRIKKSTFSKCTGLKKITIAGDISSVDENAFAECSGLNSVVFSNGVTKICYRAFDNCTSLTSIVLANSITSIDIRAFAECSGLTSITIPSSVTDIQYYAFYGCTNLSSAVFVDTNNWNIDVSDSAVAANYLRSGEQLTKRTN